MFLRLNTMFLTDPPVDLFLAYSLQNKHKTFRNHPQSVMPFKTSPNPLNVGLI